MKIHTFDARNSIYWEVMTEHFRMNSVDIFTEVQTMFCQLEERLQNVGISYEELKKVLTPSREKKKREICLFFDSLKVDDDYYGRVVLNALVPLLKDITKSAVFYGDIIAGNSRVVQKNIKRAMEQTIEFSNPLAFEHSTQFFVVYLNNITVSQLSKINDGLEQLTYYVGYSDFTFSSFLKTVISFSVGQKFLLCNKKVLQVSVDGEEEGVNYTPIDFDDSYSIINIDEHQYNSFLCYKIKRDYYDFDKFDQSMSLNSIHCVPISLEDCEIVISNDKYRYLYNNKLSSLEKIGGHLSKEEFLKQLEQNINFNYLFNLEFNKYCLKFASDFEVQCGEFSVTERFFAIFKIKIVEKQIHLVTFY